MKFLLTALNAKYIHSNPAIYSLRAYAGENLQEHIELAEYTINQPFADILADIYKRKPDVVGFSCYIWNITMILELVTELHKIMPVLPIWLGGPEVTYDAPVLLAKYPMVTGIMIGEGEETFRELLQYYVDTPVELWGEECRSKTQWMQSDKCLKHTVQDPQNDGAQSENAQKNGARRDGASGENKQYSLDYISGLCLCDGFTAPRTLVDMSTLPFFYGSLEKFENKIIYYESSRGCPFRCSYCLSSIDKKVRLRDLNIVEKELKFFLDNKVKQVKFVDRTFNCNHEHAMGIWQYIHKHDNGVTNFHFEVSADILNEEEIALLNRMRPGLVQLEIGVQSTNPDTIKSINRTMNVEKLEKIVSAINAGHNVHQHLDLIAGLPYEDYETFAKSFNRVYAMEPEQLQLGFLKVLKGSRMHERAAEYGICYMDKPPYEVLYTKWLTFEDVLRLKGIEEMVELYYNSNQFRHTLAFLVKQFETPFAMFEKLAEFYERKGYFTNSPARAYRYQVLLEFAREWDIREEIYCELLTYDMYLRENLKSRPDFAKDPAPYKEYLRRFYEQEEQERKYLPDYTAYDHKQLAKMTHMEPFQYPVWDKKLWEKVQAGEEMQAYILFDYKNRNLLTFDARTVCLPDTEQNCV